MNQNKILAYDHHFGHTNIIRFSKRLFVAVKAMNLKLTKQRNKKVN